MARALLPIELSYSPLETAFMAVQSWYPQLDNFVYEPDSDKLASYGNRTAEAWEWPDVLIVHIHERPGGCSLPPMQALDAVAAVYLRERVLHEGVYPAGYYPEPEWSSECGEFRGWNLGDIVRVRSVHGGAFAWTPVGADTPPAAMRAAVAALEQATKF